MTEAVQKALHAHANALAGLHVTMAEAEVVLTTFAALKAALASEAKPGAS